MTKLKLGPLVDDKPVKLSIELPASVYRDLIAYAELLARTTGTAGPIEPARLIAPSDSGSSVSPIHVDRSRLCKGAAVGVIDFPVICPRISVAQAREDPLAPGYDCAATRGR